MKRALQILGAALVFVVAGAGSIWILRPEWVLSAGHKSLEIAPTVAAEHMAAAQQRNAKIRTKLHSLGAAQDRSIYGDKTAPGIQNNLFDEIAEDYDRIDFSKSPVPPDFNDILVYVLSGGESDVLQKFADDSGAPDPQMNLAKGILGYVNGEGKESLEHLRTVQLLSLSPQLIGPMALARASLESASDGEKAIDLLNIARLSSPHTAVEEAAIRREVLLLLRRKAIREGLALMADYLRRFSKSAFRPGFALEFAKTLVEHDPSDGQAVVAEFSEAIEAVEPDAKWNVLLAVAQGFLGKGKLEAVKILASNCLKSENVSGLTKTRAKLYLSAADAPSVRAAESANELAELTQAGFDLSEEDAEIRETAKEIASNVVAGSDGQGPVAQDQGLSERAPSKPDAADDGDVKSYKSTLDHASAALKESDLISGGVP